MSAGYNLECIALDLERKVESRERRVIISKATASTIAMVLRAAKPLDRAVEDLMVAVRQGEVALSAARRAREAFSRALEPRK